MKSLSSSPCGRRSAMVFCWLAWLCVSPRLIAYPPAPHHVLFGQVRNQYGTPFLTGQAQLILQTATGVQIKGAITPGLGFGVNYQLEVPMDAGLTPDPYAPNALPPAAPFIMYVVVGQTTNLPIQMTGNIAQLGLPGQRTRIDLTLGVDSNGDGIPDAWELAFLAAIGSPLSLSDLRSGMDLARDGLTLQQEFLLGNYPFNPGNSFTLRLVNLNAGSPLLEFATITGHSYTVLGSADLQNWVPLSFSIPAESGTGGQHTFYTAQDIRTLQVQVIQPASGPPVRFFKLILQ